MLEPEAHRFERLAGSCYRQLIRMAERLCRSHGASHSIDCHALVHDTHLRLLRTRTPWRDAAHFVAVARAAMRAALVDALRSRDAEKRGGGVRSISFDELHHRHSDEGQGDLRALGDALALLREIDPRRAAVVRLRYAEGLSVDETAKFLGVSRRTVKREWDAARTWLRSELNA